MSPRNGARSRNRRNVRSRAGAYLAWLTCIGAMACAPAIERRDDGPIVVFNAGSLARPLRAALDSFARREHVTVEQETAGSVETARKLTELRRIPDVIAVADYEVIPALLMPAHVSWYAQFARNRMVIAYTDRSNGSAAIDGTNWWQVLTRPGMQVGRSEPSLDPNGYRTLLVWQLAERHYGRPGLRDRLAAAAPQANVRPKESDLVALLQAGELDYIWSYESIAQAAGLRYVRLPSTIDLSSPSDAATYATASVRIAGTQPNDSVTLTGEPIVYAFAVPRSAPHPALGERFAAYLLSAEGKRVLRAAKLDVLDSATLVGSEIPAALRPR